jgi:SET domain-containing protein
VPYLIKTAKHGKGLFAARNIARGEVLAEFTGPIITYNQVLRLKTPDNAFQISRNRYINLQKPGVLANHSCNPNAGVTPARLLIAIKRIAQGEEITYDYSACMDKDTVCEFASGTCHCGAKNCRGIIRGFATLPAATRRRYARLNIIQPFVRRE